MKNGRWQAKDIDDSFFLRCLDWLQHERNPPSMPPHVQMNWRLGGKHWVHMSNLEACMPMFNERVIRAKARKLIRRGLITGCACGCRGDFELTESGAKYLNPDASRPFRKATP